MNRKLRNITLIALLLLAGNVVTAQNDPQYVIKKGTHYLAHVQQGTSWTVADVESFNPNTCLWYSGPNIEHNYYFIDIVDNVPVYHYLAATLDADAPLTLSSSHPGTVVLNKTTEIYYFWDWDHGVARGIQLGDGNYPDCETVYHGLNPAGNQCWKVVWVSYESGGWKMSHDYNYSITTNAAYYHNVTVTEHAAVISNESGGAPTIADFAMTYNASPLASQSLNGTASAYDYTVTPAYVHYCQAAYTDPDDPTISIPEVNYYYYNNSYTNTTTPGSTNVTGATASSYSWTITGEGAEYLSFSSTTDELTSTLENPTLYYRTQNTTTSNKMATLTLTVTYSSNPEVTQTRTINVTVKTECQNPVQASAPVVTYDNVTVSWVPTADKYKLEWKQSTQAWTAAQSESDITTTSYTFTNLEYGKTYDYRVSAFCGGSYQTVPSELIYHFSTNAEPGVLINGAVYGGGRMADVTGGTEVIIINCDSISAVYGGNDIAGTVGGSNGSKITLGVKAGDAYATSYNSGSASEKVRVLDVYGGGNGYYAYNGSSFTAASSDYSSQSVAVNGQVKAMTQTGQVGNTVWTNSGNAAVTLNFPKIVKTAITVAENDHVKVDSLFGGAKNAFLTTNSGNGSTITINGGTIYAVFGGNNIGGGQGNGLHHIDVTNTKTKVDPIPTTGFGRDFGIAYLFGGGNKVYGSTTEITITGGQCDTVFAGGNSASVYAANLTMNVPLDKTISNAISSYSGSTINSLNTAYTWNGTGVYNVRTLFGGNNQATMECLPTLTLTSGSVGTVYGGGNAGDMMKQQSGGSITFADPTLSSLSYSFDYSTKVMMTGTNMLVDFLYGGCQMSNVGYSTWVQINNGHVGTVYGGCNISGDVGSTRKHLDAQPFLGSGAPNPDYQDVYGGTYVEAKGGTIHGNIFAGSNGFYHCLDSYGITYSEATGIVYDPAGHTYYGMNVPTHNETYLVIDGNVVIEGDAYAGGNLAPVGFTTQYVAHTPNAFPYLVGLASLRMSGGEVKGNVYGGGRMASINGSNEVRVSGGSIGTGPNGGALYGGNDRLGKAGQITNRIMPSIYNVASDGYTPLTTSDETTKVKTYVSVTGNPYINTVYGGGNGAYTYTGPGADMQYCNVTDLPIQSNIFVDIAIDGSTGPNGAGHIDYVYGGGNGVESDGFVKVFLNVKNFTSADDDHVGTIFGGNNVGNMDRIPDIILLNGNVHTVYGGCNQGAMTGSYDITLDGTTYQALGSLVQLRKEYTVSNATLSPSTQTTPTNAKVTGAVYGGCRMNGVTNNTLVLVEDGDHPADMFGGCDISGNVGGHSQVVVLGGTTGNIYGGGNGDYDYTNTYQSYTAPTCATSLVDILGGQVGKSGTNNARNVFGGGLGHNTNTTGNVTVNIGTETMAAADVPVIYGDVYGGSALGSVNGTTPNTTYQTTVNVLNGTLHGNVYGGGLGYAETNAYGYLSGNGDITEAFVYGTVQVNIGSPQANATNTTYSNNVTIDGSVFGGNNLAGSPKANVYVDVYRTAHTSTNQYPTTFPDPLTNAYFEDNTLYALHEVYGGGNLAAYVPNLTDAANYVHIHNCDNTIQYVYGGGNAADVPSSEVTIDGGLIQYVFGGGNGYGEGNPGANVLNNNTLNLDGGVMCFVFGGSNTKGGVGGKTDLNFADSPSCGIRSINELYGGGNQAPDVDGIILNVPCGTSGVKAIYGGSRMADVGADGSPQDVVLNVRGGELDKIFGGNNQGGTIYGNVTVNLYGGTITDVFGGNNQGGNVEGVITVNVLDEESTSCPLILTNVFGGGNEASITSNPTNITSPVVNVIHITEKTGAPGIKGNVYGGGNQAGVTSSPQVNIGYAASTMSGYIPQGFTPTGSYRAYVAGSVYGGCNTSGTVGGNPSVNVYDGTIGDQSNALRGIVYGGGLGSATKVKGSIAVTVNGTNAVLWGDVYGGSAKGLVNCNDTGDAATSGSTTTVTLTDGTIHGDLYGGGHGLDNAAAHVWGPVAVVVNGGTVDEVFGGNNLSGTPKDKIEVTIAGGTINNVFGGGNQADYTAPTSTPNYPEVSITNGEVTHKVVGGGNEAGITGNPTILVSGGTIGTSTDASVGIYGGCNTSGTVTGNTVVSLTGGTIGVSDSNTANIHGGGFGSSTSVTGNVTVNFGAIVYNNSQEAHTNYPLLYGDVYGGSALGNVNTDNNNTTTVNILNGQINGSVYGGGLGQKNGVNGATSDIAALVNGVVHVNIGEMESWTDENTYVLNGMADLVNCNIYGCNNLNGTPKDEVYVDIYKTMHIQTNEASYLENDATYAIENVFGGGNQAHYQPTGYDQYASFTQNGSHRTHVYFHGCDNTSRNIYGGGNAADAFGVITIIEGGRYNEIFGGGNGMVSPANIGMGGIGRRNLSGHVNYQFEGSNRQGENFSLQVYVADLPSTGTIACSGDMITDSYFFGTNMAETYGGMTDVITCDESDKYNYRYVYAGSRWAVIYGDVTITVNGGTIENLFGGSRGYNETGNTVSADIRKYPTDWQTNPTAYSQGLIEYMTTHPGLEGTGGNITVIINGGTIGNVFGGCDVLGNVEGKITVIVNETDDACDLKVGNIYGASNLTSYEPTGNSGTDSPEVKIQKAQVGFTTDEFYSSQGANKTFEGNVFGGGNQGNCTSEPKVVIGTLNNATNVTINGDVFGGGNEGNVTGSAKVIIVPTE